jgi:hypothetical protein
MKEVIMQKQAKSMPTVIKERIMRNLIYAQLSFFGFLAIAVIMTSAGFANNHGLSFYGVHYPTIVPFALGLILCDFFLLRAAAQLPRSVPPFTTLQPSLWIISALLLSILLTPDIVSPLFNTLHIAVSSLLFVFELTLGIWLVVRWDGDIFTWSLLIAQFLAGIVAMLSQLEVTHYLSQSSLAFQLMFGLLLIWSISRIIDRINAASGKKPSDI